jgi:hypothetical protein
MRRRAENNVYLKYDGEAETEIQKDDGFLPGESLGRRICGYSFHFASHIGYLFRDARWHGAARIRKLRVYKHGARFAAGIAESAVSLAARIRRGGVPCPI